MLFLGLKGTGKSSFIYILARKYSFLIYNFDIKNLILKNSDLIVIYDVIKPNAIVVFDNIDKVRVGRQEVTKTGLLKAFNRAKMQNQGRLLIVTANNCEKVPEALL
jgi:Holliday junction resolvasome RuvABC ATP-dependent DNA helicase subunit